MIIDVTALQRLPEIAAPAGLKPKKCIDKTTKVSCVEPTCQKTEISFAP